MDREAEAIENTEFAAARSAVEATLDARGETASAEETQNHLQALLAAEEARVTDALLLAEVLAPLIAAQISSTPSAVGAPSATSFPREPKTASPSAARPSASRQRDEPVLGIADLIDGMLSQERRDHSPST